MNQLLRAAIAAVGVGLSLAAPSTGTLHAHESGSVKAGILSCRVTAGFGFIFGSTRAMDCTYVSVLGRHERYDGSISKIGLDVGYLSSSVLVWAVLTPTANSDLGTLAGNYAGATAGATFGLGVGVNLMTGGSHNSIALQPISVEGNSGLYVGAGITSLSLQVDDHDLF